MDEAFRCASVIVITGLWLLPSAECVADGYAVPGGVIRAEFVVVVDQVNVRFRAHEEVAYRIESNASAEVS